jgi:hypothetical protein
MLAFSLIIYDDVAIINTNKYVFINDEINFVNDVDNYYSYQIEFQDNFMFGVKTFQTIVAHCGVDLRWD